MTKPFNKQKCHKYSERKSLNVVDHSDGTFGSGGGLWTIWNKARTGCIFHRGGSPSANSIAVIPIEKKWSGNEDIIAKKQRMRQTGKSLKCRTMLASLNERKWICFTAHTSTMETLCKSIRTSYFIFTKSPDVTVIIISFLAIVFVEYFLRLRPTCNHFRRHPVWRTDGSGSPAHCMFQVSELNFSQIDDDALYERGLSKNKPSESKIS